jgi:hypothetical protein
MFSIGAVAIASHVAIGDHAYGHIAIGRVPTGEHIIEAERAFSQITRDEVRNLLDEVYPNLWNGIKNWLVNMFRR